MKNSVFWELRRVPLVRTDVSEERMASIIRVTRIGDLTTTLAVTSNRAHIVILRKVLRLLVTGNVVTSSPILVHLMTEAICSFEASVLTRATRRVIPEDGILEAKTSLRMKTCIPFYVQQTQNTHFANFGDDFNLYFL
jgi:hypothetical protein